MQLRIPALWLARFSRWSTSFSRSRVSRTSPSGGRSSCPTSGSRSSNRAARTSSGSRNLNRDGRTCSRGSRLHSQSSGSLRTGSGVSGLSSSSGCSRSRSGVWRMLSRTCRYWSRASTCWGLRLRPTAGSCSCRRRCRNHALKGVDRQISSNSIRRRRVLRIVAIVIRIDIRRGRPKKARR